jgi:hypothetical protein
LVAATRSGEGVHSSFGASLIGHNSRLELGRA